MGWFSGGSSRDVGRCVFGLTQASAFTIIVPLAEERDAGMQGCRDAGMLAGGFQKWLLGIQKSKIVIASKIGGDGGGGGQDNYLRLRWNL